jgi:hypothetical protein
LVLSGLVDLCRVTSPPFLAGRPQDGKNGFHSPLSAGFGNGALAAVDRPTGDRAPCRQTVGTHSPPTVNERSESDAVYFCTRQARHVSRRPLYRLGFGPNGVAFPGLRSNPPRQEKGPQGKSSRAISKSSRAHAIGRPLAAMVQRTRRTDEANAKSLAVNRQGKQLPPEKETLRVCLQIVNSCHCEELKATKQSCFRAEIASLPSQ